MGARWKIFPIGLRLFVCLPILFLVKHLTVYIVLDIDFYCQRLLKATLVTPVVNLL
jgi:hypothetical protein